MSNQPAAADMPTGASRHSRRLPTAIWVMGFGSLFMDISSELVHSLLPVFMASVLGVSMLTIGIVEGVAEAATAFTKAFSGALSDHLRRRKGLLVFGYALAAFTKPVFPLASSIGWVFAARFVDRIGKGIRGAPRDALIADVTPPPLRGAAYGLRQALDATGSIIGPLLAIGFMIWFAGDIRAVLWIAVLPAIVAVAILAGWLHEPDRQPDNAPRAALPSLAGVRLLPRKFWMIVLAGAVFTLARFSEAFLVLRAQDVGMSLGMVPLVLVAMSLTFALLAYPAGAAADRYGARPMLLIGLAPLILADLALAAASSPAAALGGAALWGLHMAFTQGLFAKLVADTAPPEMRGTAFGLYNLVAGGALLLASVIAGGLWSLAGPAATFIAGAAFAALAATGIALSYRSNLAPDP